jgi:hypothetical protein
LHGHSVHKAASGSRRAKMNLLVIAPEIEGLPKLAQTSELTRLGDVEGLTVSPLTGPLVTQDRIQNRLRRGGYDVVLWSGHGKDGKLLLPGGKEIEPHWLVSEIKASNASLVILSVCDSGQRAGWESFADVLPSEGIRLVAMATDISDKAAVDYDVAMLHALVGGDSLRTAHRIGLAAIGVSDQNDRAAPQLFMPDSQATARELGAQVGQLQDAVNAGHAKEALLIIERCHVSLKELEGQFETLQDRVLKIEKRLNPPWQVWFWRWGSALVLFFGASLFFIYQTRSVLFNPWWMGTMFEAVLILLAVLCFRMASVTMEKLR